MPRRLNAQTSNPFAEIVERHREAHRDPPPVAATESKAAAGKGKSADPNYVKLTSYIRKETHLGVKRKLLDEGGGQVSDLVEHLLGEWLQR